MSELENLKPKEVFDFFREIAAIPHGSGNTKQISDYLVQYAKDRGLDYYQDDMNNVIIRKPATAGYEDAAPVMVQGHMDMVCEKTPGSNIDMTRDGLTLGVEGDWLYAENTTLGGDDGIAVAMALAAMDDETLEHPALDAVFTVDEETGMYGADALDAAQIRARKMINVDSEAEGVFTVSCAGGEAATAHIPVERQSQKGTLYKVEILGLQGGHSGLEINKERGNANILMGRLLNELSGSCQFTLVGLAGGKADNAICKQSAAELLIPEGTETSELQTICNTMSEIYAHELRASDPEVKVVLEEVQQNAEVEALDEDSTAGCIAWLLHTPNGIQHMNIEIPGLVETSLNLGVLKLEEQEMTATYAVRSSVDTRNTALCVRMESLAELLGGTVTYAGAYPAWEYREDSPLRDACVAAYEKLYGAEPKIDAMHAGLECGLFAGKMGGDFDAVSFGPDMEGVHTTDERLSISSVGRTYALLCEILKNCK